MDFFIQVISLTVYIDNTVLELKAMLQTLNLTVDLANNKKPNSVQRCRKRGMHRLFNLTCEKNPIESVIIQPKSILNEVHIN